MRTLKLYYSILPVIDSHGVKIGEVARPIIDIVIKYKEHKMIGPFRALIDSGADYNLFPADICRTLGMTLKSGQKSAVVGVGGKRIVTYRHFGVKIFAEGYPISTFADFSSAYEGTLILGQ